MRKPDPASRGWVNGRVTSLEQARITIDDPAFHAGLGLFETIAVRGQRLLEPEQHLDRLWQGANRLGVELPDRETLRRAAQDLSREQGWDCGWLKIIATRGGQCVVFGGEMDPAEEGSEATAILLPWRRNPADPLAGLKTLNYAGSTLGLEEALRRDADEGIWLNTTGHLAEGCTSNLFVVGKGKLFTPSVRDGILPGVVRGLALSAARDLGFTVHEGKVRLRRLETAREAFLTSSLRGVRPLVRFDGRPVGTGRPGQMTRAVAAEVARMRGRGTDI